MFVLLNVRRNLPKYLEFGIGMFLAGRAEDGR